MSDCFRDEEGAAFWQRTADDCARKGDYDSAGRYATLAAALLGVSFCLLVMRVTS